MNQDRMRILIDIWHPAEVHFFKNLIWTLEKRGHDILITIRDFEITTDLLKNYGFDYITLNKPGHDFLTFFLELVKRDYRLYKTAKKFNSDLLLQLGGISVAHVGTLLRKPSIGFTDTEDSKIINMLAFPFLTKICTPSCFNAPVNPTKHKTYEGYKELAYLHPNYFKPNPGVLGELGFSEKDRFFIVRFSSWGATHDIGRFGFRSNEDRLTFIEKLEEYGRVFLTTELPLPKEFDKYLFSLEPEKMHDLLYYSTMYIGEGATLASEAGVLGVPWIWISGGEMRGYLDDQERKYELGYCIPTPEKALEKAIDLLKNPYLKREWQGKREKMLRDKIDVTEWMINLVEGFEK